MAQIRVLEIIFNFFRKLFPATNTGPRTESDESESVLQANKIVPPAVQADNSKASFSRNNQTTQFRRPRIIIALDFGTYSTKVLIKRRGDKKASILMLDNHAEGYPEFTIPSLVRINRDRIYYGSRAIADNQGELYRWLKVKLLHADSYKTMGSSGRVDDQLKHEALITAYIAWVLQQVKVRLDGQYGVGNYIPILNAAAPMNHIADEMRWAVYMGMFAIAHERIYGDPSKNYSELENIESIELFQEWLKNVVIPTQEERKCEIFPENLAPVISLAQRPQMRPGMYLIVDMGAGTTEISINKVPSPHESFPVLCFCDRSVQIGAKDLDGKNDPVLIEKLIREACCTWGEGYQKVKGNMAETESWQKLSILLAGGGTQNSAIQSAFKNAARKIFYPWAGQGALSVQVYMPDGIEWNRQNANYSYLLSVAHGLTYERLEWPGFVKPFEISPALPTREKKRPEYNWIYDPS